MAAEMAWYVLRAVSGKEGKVKEYIDAEIKNGRLGGHVSQVLIPTEKVKQVQGNKQVVKERLYLPGYVLVEARLVAESAKRTICNLNTVAYHVRYFKNLRFILQLIYLTKNTVNLTLAEGSRVIHAAQKAQHVRRAAQLMNGFTN